MGIESDGQTDLALEAEAAERVAGGRRTIKASAPRMRSAPNLIVTAASPPPVSPEDPQTAFPVLGGAECEPIRYGESGSAGAAT